MTIDSSGEHKTITIAEAGTITISVDVRWLAPTVRPGTSDEYLSAEVH